MVNDREVLAALQVQREAIAEGLEHLADYTLEKRVARLLRNLAELVRDDRLPR